MTMTEDEVDSGPIRPTRQRLSKGDLIVVPLTDRVNPQDRPARVDGQTTLDRYRNRKTLEPHQLEAAYRFHRDAHVSGRFPGLVMSFEARITGAQRELQDGQVAAGAARDRAIAFLSGADSNFPLIVEHVCVTDFAAESWAVKNNLHPMKGIKTLRKALDCLCRCYGIKIV